MGSLANNHNISENNVWSSILSETQTNSSLKLPSGRKIVVLGPPSSGKTTLIAKLQGIEDPKKGSGLEYTYIEVRDEYRDDSTQLSVFTLDGDPEHAHLLHFPLNEKTIHECPLVILTVSMAEPWNVIESLEKWVGLLHDHVDNLKIDPDKVRELREERIKKWKSYEEGEEGELAEGVLTRNIGGIELVVVITKTDMIPSLERDYSLRDEHFDFIQIHIRRFCLAYGASLFYTSVKEDKNCDLLYKFLVHRIYYSHQEEFRTPALVVEKDAVFIPSGWDNLKKIQILHENLTSVDPESYYNDIVPKPLKKPIQTAETVDVEDEQKFLERQLQILNVGGTTPRGKTPSSSDKRQVGVVLGSGGVSGTTPKKGEQQNTDRVLANFFHSLLTNKKSGQSGGGSGQSSANASLNGTDC